MTAVAWYPLLRRLHTAGWTHVVYGPRGHHQHVWRRNENAVNQQSIEWDPDVAAVSIGEVNLSAAGLNLFQTAQILRVVGAFDAAPPPIRRSPAAHVREQLLHMAATDPGVTDDVFAVLAPVIEGRGL